MEYAGDSPGDGPKNRTAWAGVGDGVLSHDAGGDGQITQDREFAATDWDPTAKDDRTALLAWGNASELGRSQGVKEINGLRGRIHLALRSRRGERGGRRPGRDVVLCGTMMRRVLADLGVARSNMCQTGFGSRRNP
jgi:hypothetical protein